MQAVYSIILFHHKKYESPSFAVKLCGTRRHYFNWNKSGKEQQLLHVLPHTWKLKFNPSEHGIVICRGWEGCGKDKGGWIMDTKYR